jgi:hypothetical protein
MVYYRVEEAKKHKRNPSGNSGAEDFLVVERIAVLPKGKQQ